MGDLRGSLSIIGKELKLQFYTFSIVLLALAVIYFIIGFYIEPSESFKPLLSGPIYGILGFLPFFLYGDPFKSAVQLGSTRKQYIFSLWLSYFIFIVCMLVVHEIVSYLLELIANIANSNVTLMRVGDFLHHNNRFDNMWIDILSVIFIAGVCFFIGAIMYRVGIIPTLIGLFLIGVIVFVWYVLGDFTPLFKWIYHHIYEMFHILGAIGILLALLIYPILINVKLKF